MPPKKKAPKKVKEKVEEKTQEPTIVPVMPSQEEEAKEILSTLDDDYHLKSQWANILRTYGVTSTGAQELVILQQNIMTKDIRIVQNDPNLKLPKAV